MGVIRFAPPLRPAAIFDLDRTLLPGSSLLHVGRLALSMGLISARTMARGLWEDARYRAQGSSDRQVQHLHTRLLAMAEGVEAALMEDLAAIAAPRIVADMRPEVRVLLDRHLTSGNLTLILSASPEEVVAAVADELGADHGFGTRAEVASGRYTGRLVGAPCYGPGKTARLEAEGLPIDSGTSWAYADSMSDLPVLRSVRRPVVVSPDKELRRTATAEGWAILDPDKRSARRARRVA